MSGLVNYISCAMLWLGLAVKLPDLLRHPQDPFLRAICAVLALAGLSFVLGAPPTVGAINDLSGIPNLAAPMTYATITAYSAASQVLVVCWRGGPRTHRISRRWIVAYAFVVLGIAVTFALGEAPVERRTDLDTYYATTPFIAEMIVLYLVAHLVAVAFTTVSSLRWARQVHGWLRAGLIILGMGTLCASGYSLSKLAAVAARWFGHDWSALDTDVSRAAAGLGAFVTSVGVLIPLAGPALTRWLASWRTYARLAPLERELDDVLTRRSLRLARPRWAAPGTRLMWRQTSIHNALSYLDAFFDRVLYDRALDAELRATGDPRRAEATAWAAVIAAAAHDERGGDTPPDAGRLPGEGPAAGALVAIARALATSPLVAAARLGALAADGAAPAAQAGALNAAGAGPLSGGWGGQPRGGEGLREGRGA
ncbi:MAB_1171c family putative transporter [Streptomyces sp. NPDC059477]|uniref:MAB_1171c family putative transporter n=1 Tax=Streptomyces sp. NPDC059477 TaxID=3346847 RepID=UPI0036BD0DB6